MNVFELRWNEWKVECGLNVYQIYQAPWKFLQKFLGDYNDLSVGEQKRKDVILQMPHPNPFLIINTSF